MPKIILKSFKILVFLLTCCLTDRGTVQKVIVLPKDTSTTEELILEEVEVFKVKKTLNDIIKRAFD